MKHPYQKQWEPVIRTVYLTALALSVQPMGKELRFLVPNRKHSKL